MTTDLDALGVTEFRYDENLGLTVEQHFLDMYTCDCTCYVRSVSSTTMVRVLKELTSCNYTVTVSADFVNNAGDAILFTLKW